MSNVLPTRRRGSIGPVLLAVAMTLLAETSFAASGWLDRLKEVLGGEETTTGALSSAEIGNGLKEALKVGTERVVAQLGRTDGFNLDPAIHIPLPKQLDRVQDVLEKIGMDATLADLETRLNRAAEVATPKAKALFVNAIGELTLDDVMAIYNGPEDAATQYFKSKMSTPLAAEMKPVVDASLADVGAIKTYDRVMESYRTVPFAPKVDANLSDYVVEKANEGIFHYLAKEEAAIRADPAKRTTDLLKRVFGR